MSKQKRVRCFCHGALSAGPQYQTAWEDVWLRWKGKPGRKVYHDGPCLCTRGDLEADLVFSKDLARQYPDIDAFPKDIAVAEQLLAVLDRQPFARDTYACPNVYTNAECIDRAEAERMLTFYLKEAHGVVNPKFVWPKQDRDGFFVHSMSFAGITEEELAALPRHDPPEPEVIVRS